MKSKIILLAVGLSLTAACNSNNTDDTKFIKSVITVTPQSLNHQTDKTFSGIVRENREISAGFKTPGQIINVYANEGDFVKQGQLLAVLDDKDYKLGLQAAEIQYNQLNDEVARLKKLFEKQSISGNDYEKAVAGLKQLEIQLQSNKNKLEYTKLYSPVSGYVQKRNFETSEMVDAGTSVFTILDTKNLEVEINIPSTLYNNQQNISKVFCSTNFNDGKRYLMKINSLTPKADGNQLYKMQLSFIDKPDAGITSGINIEARVILKNNDGKSGFSVPLHAVFNEGGKNFVFVLTDGKTVRKTPVTLGEIIDNENITITEGLSGNEQIIKAGTSHLQDGETVKTIEFSASNIGEEL